MRSQARNKPKMRTITSASKGHTLTTTKKTLISLINKTPENTFPVKVRTALPLHDGKEVESLVTRSGSIHVVTTRGRHLSLERMPVSALYDFLSQVSVARATRVQRLGWLERLRETGKALFACALTTSMTAAEAARSHMLELAPRNTGKVISMKSWTIALPSPRLTDNTARGKFQQPGRDPEIQSLEIYGDKMTPRVSAFVRDGNRYFWETLDITRDRVTSSDGKYVMTDEQTALLESWMDATLSY